MNAQVKREEAPKDTSLFYQFQFRTDKPPAEREFSKFPKAGTTEAERLELAGVRRIMIELEGKPEMKEFCHRYSNLVDSVADILKNDLKIKPNEEERFLTETWGIMTGNLNVKYGTNKFGFLKESLETAKWDCDNAAFLMFDVAKQLGVNAKIATAPRHAFIITDNFFLETGRKDRGKLYPIGQLEMKHPVIYAITSDLEAIQVVSYQNRGVANYEKGLYDEAIADYTKARELNPKYADVYGNRGSAYHAKKLYKEAIADYDEAIRLDDKDAAFYYNRAGTYADQKSYKKAISDYDTAIGLYEKAIQASSTKEVELEEKCGEAYNNRGTVFARQGLYKEALADFTKALEYNPKDANARKNFEKAEKLEIEATQKQA